MHPSSSSRSHPEAVPKCDRAFVQIGRVLEWWQALPARSMIGGVAMPVRLTPTDIAHRM